MKFPPFSMKHMDMATRKSSRFFSSKPKWNSNGIPNLIITHPTLLLIESCNSMAQLKQIQAHMIHTGLIFHLFPISRLLSFCALDPHGDIDYANSLFLQIPNPNTYIWNTMMRGYVNSQLPRSCLSIFCRMIYEGIEMDKRSYVFMLKGCQMLNGIYMGKLVHCRAWKVGFVDDSVVRNALLHFYSEKRELCEAKRVFQESKHKDVVCWTSMISALVRINMPDDALDMFDQMSSSGVEPNDVTLVTLFSACALKKDLLIGTSLHELAERKGMIFSLNMMNAMLDMYVKCGALEKANSIFRTMKVKDVFSWTIMIDGYSKKGDIDMARQYFDEMPNRNVVSWTALISCYSQNNRPKDALEIFQEMKTKGFHPTESALVSVLSACSQLSCLDIGKTIHDYYIKQKRIALSPILANALVDMYAKSGCIHTAKEIFLQMPYKDLVSWNSMIIAYANHGHAEKALALFHEMISIGLKPDDITYIGVLSACAHNGYVDKGWKYFKSMDSHLIEHFACMVDLLSRVGLLEEAYKLIMEMPMKPDTAVWGALLNGCRIHKNLELGKVAADKLMDLDPYDSGIYVIFASLCANEKSWNDVRLIRSMMREKGSKKNRGCSLIEMEGYFHEFLSADKTHPLSDDIYDVLRNIFSCSKMEGYDVCH